MNPAPTPLPVEASAPDIARRVAMIVAGLAALVARRFLTEPRFKPLIVPLWTRLTRAAGRFERLMAALAANRLRTPRPRPSPTRPDRKAPDTARPTALPSGHGWLIRALSHEAAAYASQLQYLLAEPGVADLLAACPQAGRILRPLGRMLGIDALAPKRIRPRRRAPEASANDAPPPPRPRLRRPQPFPLHPPNAAWPHRPSADWASAWRRRRAHPA